MRRVLRSPFLYVAVAAVVAVVLVLGLRGGSGRTTVGLGAYRADLDAHRVATAVIHDSSDEVTGNLTSGTAYVVSYPARYSPTITAELVAAVPGVTDDPGRGFDWSGLLFGWLPVIVLAGAFVWMVRSMQGGGSKVTQFGKTRARPAGRDRPTVTFADVAGADEAVAELQEIKEFLEAPARFVALGARIPKGVLLVGPPGTGKTLLARAVAGEAGVPFYSISGSDFVEMFVGVGASRVRDLFEQAKANAPAIVFMDEIDAVGRQRGTGLGGGHDEREQTLNQLLVEMDGFDVRGGVILIAATNRPDILDPALLRPGRFDRQIVVDRPDLGGRRRILAVHAAGKPLGPTVSIDVLARRTPGFTGADLANLLNEAALLTARRNLRQIGMRECEEAIDRVMAGPERKNLVMSERDKLVTAYHEAGHTIVGHVLPHADPIHKVSIVARSRSLGLTFTLPEDRFNHSRSQLRDTMAMCLGGRTAEELVFGEPTTGAENDIEKTTRIARAMVTEYGMSDVVGPQQLTAPGGEIPPGRDPGAAVGHSEQVAAVVDAEVRHLIADAHDRARAILEANRSILDDLARALVERETLDTAELMAVIGGLDPWPAGPPAPPAPAPVPAPPVTAAADRPARVRPLRARAATRATATPATAAGRTPAATPATAAGRTTAATPAAQPVPPRRTTVARKGGRSAATDEAAAVRRGRPKAAGR